MRVPAFLIIVIAATLALAACSGDDLPPLPEAPAGAPMITVSSSSMTNGRIIRSRFTCDGVNFSPEIEWSGVPDAAAALVLVVDDPDAPSGSFIHWLVYNLPPDVEGLGEGVGHPFASTPQGGSQGINSFGGIGYSGPCPPFSETHLYKFHLYAVETELPVAPLAGPDDVFAAMEGLIVGYGLLQAPYIRQALSDPNVVFDLTPEP